MNERIDDLDDDATISRIELEEIEQEETEADGDDEAPSVLDRRISIACGRHKQDKHFANRTRTVGEIVEGLKTFRTGDKDGPCILQGALAAGAGQRIAPNVAVNFLFMTDYDTGSTLDEIRREVERRGLFAVIWTTHSHLKAVTEVPQAAMLKFLDGRDGWSGKVADIGVEHVVEYLTEVKRYLPRVLEGATLGESRIAPGGMMFFVHHAPMPKYRALFVLKQPFDFAKRGGSQADAIREWKARYAAASDDFGLPWDTACVDPSRLMFLPSAPQDATFGPGQREVVVVDGEAFDFEALRIDPVQPTKARAAKGEGEKRAKFKTPGLAKFLKGATDLQVVEWYEAQGGEVRHRYDDGRIDGVCGNADGHTGGDDPSDRGFLLKSADGDDKWRLFCPHTNCPKDDPWQLLDLLCQQFDVGVESLKPYSAKAQAVPGAGQWVEVNRRYDASSPANVRLAVELLGVRLRYDAFADKMPIIGPKRYGEIVKDASINAMRMDVYDRFGPEGFKPTSIFFWDAVCDFARRDEFHPVLDYWAALPDWDGTKRVDTWLIDYCGAGDTKVNRAFGSIFLIAMIRRVKVPGEKFDAILTLEGPQGLGKSKLLKMLAGKDEWHTDSVELTSKQQEVMEQTKGKLIVEFAELAGMGKADIEKVKSMLSRSADNARLAYARSADEVKRSWIGCATTNNDKYLRDQTGNRRFWPVKVTKIDLVGFKRDLPQILAEARAREAAGESIELDPKLYDAAKLVQADRLVEHPWENIIGPLLDDLTGKISPATIWEDILHIPPIGQRAAEQDRLNEVMAKLGWEKVQLRFHVGRVHGWRKGEFAPNQPTPEIFIKPATKNEDGSWEPATAVRGEKPF